MSARKFLSMLPLQDQGLFRKALNGAAFASDVLCHFNDTGSDLCKFRGERDSRKHRFWACPAFHAEKSELSADFLQLVDRLPACLTQAGWAIPSETHDEWWSYLIELQHGPPRSLQCVWMDGLGWVDLFTGGSCCLPTSEEVRFASWSVCRANPDVTLQDSDNHNCHSWCATGSFAVSIPCRTVRCGSSYFVGSLLWLQKQVVDRLSRCCHKTPRPVGWNVETSDQL